MSPLAWFCLGTYTGGVVLGMVLCLTMLDDYVFEARLRLVLCVIFWPLVLLAAAFCAAAYAIGKMIAGRDIV